MAELKPEDLKRLEIFIKSCEKCPQILWTPELKFFRDFIEGLGGIIPAAETSSMENDSPSTPSSEKCPKMEESASMPDEESEESEVELNNDGVLEPEQIDPPEMGDGTKVVSEDDEIAAGEKRSEAMGAVGDGDLDKAVSLFTEAIKLNPGSALLYAKRASILLKQKRIKAALRDCNEAVNLNPDSAAAHKFRGRAQSLLGNWLEAAQDLRLACRLDFDEQADEWLKEVQPNATKLEEHERKYQRKRQDRELKEKMEKVRKAREEHRKAQEKEEAKAKSSFPGGMPFNMSGDDMPEEGSDNVPGGMGNLGELFKDPEILAAMQDPEVAAAFQDVSSNPANIFKYQSNPKVSAVINKLIKKVGGGGVPGGMPGGMPGGFPGGMPGGFPGGMPGGFPGGMPGGFPGGFPGGMPGDKPPSSTSDDLD